MSEQPEAGFHLELTYFKKTGKLYTTERVYATFPTVPPLGSCYMVAAVDWVKTLRKLSALPGLQSGRWEGYILVDCDEGYPCLVLPEGQGPGEEEEETKSGHAHAV